MMIPMYKIIQKRRYWLGVSLLLLIPGMVALGFWGLDLGIDFRGGSLMTVEFPDTPPNTEAVTNALANTDVGETTVQPIGDRALVLRMPELSEEKHEEVLAALQAQFPEARELSFESIGPTLGRELQSKALQALLGVFIMIILFITWAFRRVSQGPVSSWVYGLSAFVAMFHDVLMVIGIFAILGHYFHIQIDSLFVTALLTVLGFSIHDTIVVFDRIRERLLTHPGESFEESVNVSLNQTLVRSLNTSLTTLFVLATLLLFGGHSIRSFVLALFIGIASGTYSSIFVASPLLVIWERWRSRRT
jgi:preprotein translocase subunit SecF